jgi:hypothetical protein
VTIGRASIDWYDNEDGCEHVAAYLKARDLSSFDPKARPPKTQLSSLSEGGSAMAAADDRTEPASGYRLGHLELSCFCWWRPCRFEPFARIDSPSSYVMGTTANTTTAPQQIMPTSHANDRTPWILNQ